MPKVYAKINAEFVYDIEDASEFAKAINCGSRTLSLTIRRVDDPLLFVLFPIGKEDMVSGEFSAAAQGNEHVNIRIEGIICINTKAQYVNLLLEEEAHWTLPIDKVVKGVKILKYRNYYGDQVDYCLEVAADKSLKKLKEMSCDSKPVTKKKLPDRKTRTKSEENDEK